MNKTSKIHAMCKMPDAKDDILHISICMKCPEMANASEKKANCPGL